MTIDGSTISFASALAFFASGLFLLVHALQTRTYRVAFLWGAASCGLGVGISLLSQRGVLPDWATLVMGSLILDLSTGAVWTAARIFNRGRVDPYRLGAAVVVWFAAILIAGASGHNHLAPALSMGGCGCLQAGGAFEFWLGRRERLRGRLPMILLMIVESLALFLFTTRIILGGYHVELWIPTLQFSDLFYATGTAIFLISMLNNRSEIKLRTAALTDPLTGLANRRAFMELADGAIEACREGDTAMALLAFDLDQFKQINDSFGHPMGDQALRIFADVVSNATRPADIAGRIGGEEFALVLPGCRADAALAVGRRICSRFQSDAQFVNGQRIGATVSVGVATFPDHASDLAGLIASADKALYRAKNSGRNRVVLASRLAADPDAGNVVRLA